MAQTINFTAATIRADAAKIREQASQVQNSRKTITNLYVSLSAGWKGEASKAYGKEVMLYSEKLSSWERSLLTFAQQLEHYAASHFTADAQQASGIQGINS